jgi:lipopolysaccharide/colanic/teichoic acid biosynthesis glycosyltransferase
MSQQTSRLTRLAIWEGFRLRDQAPAGRRAFGYVALKPALDAAIALPLLVLCGPLLGLLVVLVRLSSSGPAIYRQVRVGHAGTRFMIYKIRTMRHDCERGTGPLWSTPGDPRVTALGRVLRRTHLDELPQLLNVVRGEMSLVGPRPERPEFAAELERVLPRYRDRLTVRPGVTGLAQVQLPPDIDVASVRSKLGYDLCYVERLGPWFDLKILAATALKLVGVPFQATRWLLALPTPDADDADHARHPSEPFRGARPV